MVLAPQPVPGVHTVLLVEDHPTIRRYAARVLEQAGCRVFPAADGKEALHLFDLHQDSIELLLTDIDLPDQTGYALARAARLRCETIRILYATGSPPADNEAAFRPVAPVLSKPYDAEGLVRAVAEALADV